MNIFFLDRDPTRAAACHSDVHIVKMPLETAQMLCTVLHQCGLAVPYRPVQRKHPCVLWAAASLQHYRWLKHFGLVLCAEYQYRSGRRHACQDVIEGLSEQPPFPDRGWIDPPQAMPDAYKRPDVVDAYRAYYAGEKAVFAGKGPARWTGRPVPEFMLRD